MLTIIFKKGKYFKKLIENCNSLVSNGTLNFTEHGINFQSTDANNISVINFNIPLEAFEKYNVPINQTLSINFERLVKIFKTYKDTDEMKMTHKNNTDSIIFTFTNNTTKKRVKQTVKLINLEISELEIPEYKEDCELIITPMTIYNIIKDFNNFGDYVKIETIEGDEDLDIPNKIKFKVSDLEGESEFLYEENGEDIKEININNNINLNFNITYLTKFGNFCAMSNSLKIKLTKDYPLEYNYKTPIGTIKLYLSPQIDE